MALNNHSLTFCISEIPDPAFSQYQAIANGDIRRAIADGCEHILRTLANMPSKSVSAELIFVYNPAGNGYDRQSRLNLYLRLWSSQEQVLQSLGQLVQGGLLSRFYELKHVRDFCIEQGHLSAQCNIVRREDFIQPLHSCDFNARIPDCYYTITSLASNDKNDYLTFDKVLDIIKEPVVISIKISPADISEKLHAHTGYLARLAGINRTWDDDYMEDHNIPNYLEDNSYTFANAREKLNPLNYKDPLADDIQRQQRRFHETLRRPHFMFNIQVLAKTEATAQLIGSTLAESAFEEGSYRLINSQTTNESFDKLSKSSNPIKNSKPSISGYSQGDFDVQDYNDLRDIAKLATVEELLGLFKLPIASFSSPFCIRKNTDPPFIDPKDLIVLGYDEQGCAGNSKPVARGIHVDVLKKHFSTFGLPGMGKTTSNINILIQLNERGIPFMVFESAKTEYRVLKKFKKHKKASIRKLAKELRIFTAGNEKASCFRFNPLRIPPGVDVDEHIENLLACFKGSLPVQEGSVPALLGEALELVYEEFPDREKPPVMSDLVSKVQEVLASKGYSSETRANMQTVIEVRLGVLAQRIIGKVFQCRHGVNIEELMKTSSVIEIDRLASEQKCLLILFILNEILENLKTSPPPTKDLRFVIVVEEAHNLIGASNGVSISEDVADPKSYTAEVFSKMLVELRALGVGIILSDQHPSSLEPSASKSVGSKMAFKQVYSKDRDELARSMLFGGIEEQDIARLLPGEAYFFTEGYFGPRRIRTVNLHKELGLTDIPSDEQLHEIICQEKWFRQATRDRVIAELNQFKEDMDQYDTGKTSVSRCAKRLSKLRGRLQTQKHSKLRKEGINPILAELRSQRKKLLSHYRQFIKSPYRRFSYLQDELERHDELIIKFGKSNMNRFEGTIKPGTKKLLEFFDKSIKKCIKLKN